MNIPTVQLYLGDCLDLLPTLATGSVDLVFCDPPYNISKAVWDKWPTQAQYLEWCGRWVQECHRVLKGNGAFWVSHSEPKVLARISDMIDETGRRMVNWVTWDKYNGAGALQGYLDGYTVVGGLRSFQQMAEYLVYHTGERAWVEQTDDVRGFIFEPLRAYLDRLPCSYEEAESVLGWTGASVRHCFVGGLNFWRMPTPEKHAQIQSAWPLLFEREYEDLRREYEDLRREYEDLRYTFNNPGKVSSVWQIPPAPPNKVTVTPKPEALLERIIKATSNEGDLIVDPFVGSGTTARVALKLRRQFWGCDVRPEAIEDATESLAAIQLPFDAPESRLPAEG